MLCCTQTKLRQSEVKNADKQKQINALRDELKIYRGSGDRREGESDEREARRFEVLL